VCSQFSTKAISPLVTVARERTWIVYIYIGTVKVFYRKKAQLCAADGFICSPFPFFASLSPTGDNHADYGKCPTY
jgi:hypothetical protein